MKGKNSRQAVDLCVHCGNECDIAPILFDEMPFCCNGCMQAYQLIHYAISCAPEEKTQPLQFKTKANWEELNLSELRKQFIQYEDKQRVVVVFRLPQMHCSSCVYVLEHLNRLNPKIQSTTVNFSEKTIRAVFDADLPLSEFAATLDLVGYAPFLLKEIEEDHVTQNHRKHRIKALVISGFCFGNIMLFSLPEYFNLDIQSDTSFVHFFRWAALIFSLPVFLYGSREFYRNAWAGIRGKYMHIDVPLVLSLMVAYGRSLYEVISESGSGYFDSYTGIVFFMLVGRQFQDVKTDRLGLFTNFKSFFPISVKRKSGSKLETIALSEIKPGDEIQIHTEEIIPFDGELLSVDTSLDYSFVTGESRWVEVLQNEMVFSGARNMGPAILLRVEKTIDQSQLGSLWNNQAKQNESIEKLSFTHRVAKWFTLVLILLSVAAFLYWIPFSTQRAFQALTTALIVACPCALLLSHTFATGNASRVVSELGIWVKNGFVWDQLAKIRQIYFDKTGTLTNTQRPQVSWTGSELSSVEIQIVSMLCSQSIHPVSQVIYHHLNIHDMLFMEGIKEIPGQGIVGRFQNETFELKKSDHGTGFYKNNHLLGEFQITFALREGIKESLKSLETQYQLGMLTGDNNKDQQRISNLFHNTSALHYAVSPIEKKALIKKANKESGTAYFGDGLNDTGALNEALVGFSVRDAHERFTPAADVLFPGNRMNQVHQFFAFSKRVKQVIQLSFIFSLVYNFIGLSFALTGTLSPLIAAILMPVSTITIILITTIGIRISFHNLFTDEYQRAH